MLREAYDEERRKDACAECGKIKGHKTTCSKYEPPDPEPLTALEKRFVGSAVRQHETLKDYYAGRTDADAAFKALVATIPTHEALEEYTSRGGSGIEEEANKKVEEANQKLEEQEGCIAELRSEIALLTEQNENLRKENENLQQRLKAINAVPENLRDETITATLAAEPDTFQAAEVLRIYFNTAGHRVLPPEMALGSLLEES